MDDFLAQAAPETKPKLIRDEQALGKLVAMCGDGTNHALAQADVGAMNTGTMAARIVALVGTKLIDMFVTAVGLAEEAPRGPL